MRIDHLLIAVGVCWLSAELVCAANAANAVDTIFRRGSIVMRAKVEARNMEADASEALTCANNWAAIEACPRRVGRGQGLLAFDTEP